MAIYDTRYGLTQPVVNYLNQGLPSISGIFSDTPNISPFLEDTEAEPTNAVGLTPEQLALLYPQYNLGNNGGDGGDDGNTNVVDTTNNAGITSLGGLFDYAKGKITPGTIASTLAFGPVPTLAYNIGKSIFGNDDNINTNPGEDSSYGTDPGVANMAQARGLTKEIATRPSAFTGTYQDRSGDNPGSGTNVGGTGTAAAADTSQGQTGYGSCFIAGTKVTMADGTFKNIEDIKVGDKVKGHKENNEVIKLDPTLLADRKLYSFNNNEHYFFTSEHPFMTEEGWKSIKPEKTKERDGVELYNQLKGELKIGDKLVTDKSLIEITDIKSKEINKPDMPLYNFNVSNDNSYIADGYVVHNKGGDGGNGGNGGGTYVCTASYANNLITPLDFKTLKKYGIKLRRNDKYLMKAYDWFGPKLAAAVKKGKLVNFAKHSTSMWKYEQTKQDVSFKMKFMIRFNKIITRPIIRTIGVFLTIKEKLTK
jgi:hypothetical protein